MTRHSRTSRRRGVRVQLTERDEALLFALVRFRVARTSQLLAYAFPGVRRDTGLARLRLLFDSGYLKVLRGGPLEENRYCLGPSGRRFVLAHGQTLRPVPRGGLAHHDGVLRTWIDLASCHDVELARCLPDWELREEAGAQALGLIPDLFTLLRRGDRILPVAFEVDCGTESAAVWRAKAEQYTARWGKPPGLYGWERFALVVVLLAPERRPVVEGILQKVWVVPWGVVDGSAPVSAVVAKVLAELEGPLSGSPDGKGSATP